MYGIHRVVFKWLSRPGLALPWSRQKDVGHFAQPFTACSARFRAVQTRAERWSKPF
jgi:hypothetical protein